MISEDEVSTLYTLTACTSRPSVNYLQPGNVLNGNMDASTHDTVKEPHTGGGSSKNV